MKPPKIVTATVLDNLTLLVEFSNHDRKQYSIAKLLDKPMFQPLKNPAFFRSFRVDEGGYGIVWNEDIDLSEWEVWQNGVDVGAIDDHRTSVSQ